MDEKHERRLRRQALRRWLRGERPGLVAQAVGRSREWLHKWRRRFVEQGWRGLNSQSRRPQRMPRCYDRSIRRCIVQCRRILEKVPVGLIGPQAVRQKLKQGHLRPLPSGSTIARILRQAGLVCGSVAPAQPHAYYPHPHAAAHFRLHALDWTCRYLPGGRKAFAFHTVDYASHDLHQDILGDKSAPSACAHAMGVWRGPLGLPDALQLDNDAALAGSHRDRRSFGRFVRLCLAVGVEPIFLPFYEPKRNELVEELNGLWQWALWRRRRFQSLGQVQRSQSRFLPWYRHHYFPPALGGQTPAQASRRQPVVRLSVRQQGQLSQPLPITAGRVHFIRLVDAHGQITLFNENWRVGRRWSGEYVWATVSTQRRRLEVYHRASAGHKTLRIKSWSYCLAENVVPLPAEFRRRVRRRTMSAML